MTAIRGITSVGVPVTDQDRALAFYTERLGMAVQMDSGPGGDFRWLVVAPAATATGIALVAFGQPTGVDTGIRLSTADAATDRDELAAAGVDVDAALTDMGPGVPPMFTLRDQDGNTLYVVEA